MSTEKKTAKPDRPSFQGLLLATIVSAIGTCAMAGSLFLQNFARRFPASGAFSGNFNVTRTFNATRPFNMQIAAQRIPTGFGYGSWLSIVGFSCLLATTIIVVVLLFQNRQVQNKARLESNHR